MIFLPKDYGALQTIAEYQHAKKRRIVFTNGCFDILHAGHIRCLSQASRHGDILFVGVNSDASVRRLKGKNRPVQPENDRAYIVSFIRSVVHVVIFDDTTPERIIRLIRPHVLIKGADWEGQQIAGSDLVERVVFIPMVPGRSTSKIIERGKK